MSLSIIKSHRSLSFLGVALALLVAAPVLTLSLAAQPPGGPGIGPHGAFGAGGPPDAPGERLLARLTRLLDLTDAQVEQAEALFEELKAAGEPLRTEAEAIRMELEGLLQADEPDPAAVGSRVIRLHELREEGRALRESFEASFAAILTPEQLERWELAKDLRSFFDGKGPGRGPGHGGPR